MVDIKWQNFEKKEQSIDLCLKWFLQVIKVYSSTGADSRRELYQQADKFLQTIHDLCAGNKLKTPKQVIELLFFLWKLKEAGRSASSVGIE